MDEYQNSGLRSSVVGESEFSSVKIKNFMNENQKFHERKSKISWTKIKNFMNENQKFHGRKSKIYDQHT